ncbi:MAG: LacI family DNA-binding transcriptional regulator [Rhodoplanes sp.]|nr:LacI family DNA-binding transcriptional regulator [Rhodoplanes sp.]
MSTAARVIRGSDATVDASLKDRVHAAAASLSYVPNVMARNLRAGAPTLVGLVVGDMLDPFYGEIAEAITEQAETMHSMLAVVCNMHRDPELELKYCRRLLEYRVGGLILAGGGFHQWSHRDRLAELTAQMVASGVVVTTLTPRGIDVPAFHVDNEEVGRLAAEELLSAGHRRIGILIGTQQNDVTWQRIRGMEDALVRAGAEYHITHVEYTSPAAEAGVASLFTAYPGITGVIAGSYAMSMGIFRWLRASGRSVPNDVSVVGIGNTRIAEWMSPKLTAINLKLDQFGCAALSYIAAKSGRSEPTAPPSTMPEIVHGESVSRVSQGPHAGGGQTRLSE